MTASLAAVAIAAGPHVISALQPRAGSPSVDALIQIWRAPAADSESLIRGTDPALSSAFDVALDFDHTKVQISQPTYFETGALKLARPYKKQAAGSVLFEEDKLSLRSPARPVLFSLTHQRGVNRIGFKVEKKASVPVQYRIGWTRAF